MDMSRHKRGLVCAVLCIWQLIVCIHEVGGRQDGRTSRYRTASHQQQRNAVDVKGKILELQCYAKCNTDSGRALLEDSQSCYRQCQQDIVHEPRRGHCPNKQSIALQHMQPMERLYCLDNCSYDYDCPEVQKCCDTSCGPVCFDAIGVVDDVLLPPIPKILKCKLTRGNKVEITIQLSANSTYYCHVEARYHFGVLFAPRKLSAWQWQVVEKIAEVSDARSKRIDISMDLKPGRWYQVRVATVNAYGFRGYSEPSKEFRLSNHPKPPKAPADLQVTSSQFDGHHYKLKIVWCPSKSNLPIEKYKIIWSLYVKSKDESFVSNEAYVRDAHQYEITKLSPDSSYYIQVQAMSINGSRRLKSEKFSLLYNTTQPAAPYRTIRCSQQYQDQGQHFDNNANSVDNKALKNPLPPILASQNQHSATTPTYEVRYRLNRKIGMIVQITGLHSHKEKVYELCPKDTNCEQREYSAIRAKKDSLEFSKLNYNTTYMLKAVKPGALGPNATSSSMGSFVFTTPKCENFKKRFPKMQIKC